jgi:hypothetical protein
MGSTHIGSSVTRRIATVGAVAGVLALTACAGSDGDDDAATSATEAAMDAPAATMATGDADDAGFGVVGQESEQSGGATAPEPAGRPEDVTVLQPVGQQLAIAAHATMQTADVRRAVERITTTVATHGGRVVSADIDYAAPTDEDEGTSRATLVLAVPPAELSAVRNVLDDTGDVLSYEQLAEDVTDQLADLDTRIANQRASIERIRELYANATDVDAIVRIETELTSRETTLEQMLATQQQVSDRVAMSTLTVDITTAPDAVEPADDDGTGIGDALAAGWSAFAGGVFALVLALAAALPFVLTLLAVTLVVLFVLKASRHARRPLSPSRSESEPLRAEEPVSANRQG